jgi:hypothetical protein
MEAAHALARTSSNLIYKPNIYYFINNEALFTAHCCFGLLCFISKTFYPFIGCFLKQKTISYG